MIIPVKPVAGNWILLVGRRSLNSTMLEVIARLAQAGSLRVFDGGNRFNAYLVARAVHGRAEVLNRITISRAFTCYQMLSLLESTPAVPIPFVILDLLSTFYDESVQAWERKRLLRACIKHLERLAGSQLPCLGSTSCRNGLPDICSEAVAPLREDPARRLCSVNDGLPGGIILRDGDAMQIPPQPCAGGVISVHPPALPSQTAVEMLGQLQASATDTYFIQPAAPAAEPVRLF
jgi:hypothetical protein